MNAELQQLVEMVRVLRNHGDMFTGGPSRENEVAQEWIDEGFDADVADDWMSIGVWDPSVASALYAGGLSAAMAKAAAAKMESEDLDPIYAACNGDLDPQEIIDACE